MSDRHGSPEALWFEPSGTVPNSASPVLIYRVDLPTDGSDPAGHFEQLLERNGWTDSWRNGVYPFHHFHSTAHEVLGVARGRAKLRLGGEGGRDIEVAAADVLLLPAGTGHKKLSASSDFLVVGAYPEGSDCDLIHAERMSGEALEAAVRNIARVPLPDRDPVLGGPIRAWRKPE